MGHKNCSTSMEKNCRNKYRLLKIMLSIPELEIILGKKNDVFFVWWWWRIKALRLANSATSSSFSFSSYFSPFWLHQVMMVTTATVSAVTAARRAVWVRCRRPREHMSQQVRCDVAACSRNRRTSCTFPWIQASWIIEIRKYYQKYIKKHNNIQTFIKIKMFQKY